MNVSSVIKACWKLSYPSPSRCINVSLHKGKTSPTEHELGGGKIWSLRVTTLCTASKQAGTYKCVRVTDSPIYRTEIHSQHHALLRVLTAIGWDHHHVAGDLRVSALQSNRLQQEKHGWCLDSWSTTLRLNFVCVCVYVKVCTHQFDVVLWSEESEHGLEMLLDVSWWDESNKTQLWSMSRPALRHKWHILH